MKNLIKNKEATAQPEPQGERTPTGGRNMVRSMAFQRKKPRMDPITESPEDELNSGRFDPNQHSLWPTDRDGTPEDTDAVAMFPHGVPKLNLKMTKAPLYQPRGDSDMSKSKSRSKSGSGIRNQFLSKAIL
jgi:hypothetical protein